MHTTTQAPTWWERTHGADARSARRLLQHGVRHRGALPIYSGGLGVLAGDHLKAAAELGIPLVGVGLLYRGGYFEQGLDEAGRQTEDYQPVDPEAAGLVREPVSVEVDLAGATIAAAVWRKDVGSVPLYLLEVGLAHRCALRRRPRAPDPAGAPARRRRRPRAGGARRRADRLPHERGPLRVPRDRARAGARRGRGSRRPRRSSRCARSTVFTTHTPVPAGNEMFDEELVDRYVGRLAAAAGLGREALLALGRFGDEGGFGLTPLALRLSAYANGVSALHGEVAREMWAALWPGRGATADRPRHERRPPRHLARPRARRAAARGRRRPGGAARRGRAGTPRAHDRRRRALAAFTPRRGRGSPRADGLDPGRLTIGFARRFATYKRADLVFSDVERLLALPVQIVVAGKAHPQDVPGKDVMQRIVELAREPRAQRADRLPRGLRHRPRARR